MRTFLKSNILNKFFWGETKQFQYTIGNLINASEIRFCIGIPTFSQAELNLIFLRFLEETFSRKYLNLYPNLGVSIKSYFTTQTVLYQFRKVLKYSLDAMRVMLAFLSYHLVRCSSKELTSVFCACPPKDHKGAGGLKSRIYGRSRKKSGCFCLVFKMLNWGFLRFKYRLENKGKKTFKRKDLEINPFLICVFSTQADIRLEIL